MVSPSVGAPDGIPPPPPVAAEVFGEQLALAEQYARLLCTDGVVRGLIGPRETPRIWDRHLINCAVVAELIDHGESIVDVGSGAGLPGLVLAIARPDVPVTLVEPMLRRTVFLSEVVAALGLADRVSVVRARAEEAVDTVMPADVVTARALAPLDRLARWCVPLTRRGGRVLALKGASAAEEIAAHAAAVRAAGGRPPVIRHCGEGRIEPPAIVVEVQRR